jgi:hypothetical protein
MPTKTEKPKADQLYVCWDSFAGNEGLSVAQGPACAAKIARDLAVAGGITQDKAALRKGQPTEIRRVENVADIFKALAQK